MINPMRLVQHMLRRDVVGDDTLCLGMTEGIGYEVTHKRVGWGVGILKSTRGLAEAEAFYEDELRRLQVAFAVAVLVGDDDD